MFENLHWSEIISAHYEKWANVQKKYHILSLYDVGKDIAKGIFPIEYIKRYEDIMGEPIGTWRYFDNSNLYRLAEYCLNVCYLYIFSEYRTNMPDKLEELKYLDIYDDLQNIEKSDKIISLEMFIRPIDDARSTFYKEMKDSFCRYLVVSFLHRFYSDNLIPMDREACITSILESFPEFEMKKDMSSGDKLIVNEARREFRKERRNKFDVLCGSLKTIRRATDRKGDDDLLSSIPDTLLRAPNWMFSFAMAEVWKKSIFYDKEQEPSLKNRVDSFFTKKEKSSRGAGLVIDDQLDLIARGELTPLLFGYCDDENDSEIVPIIGIEQKSHTYCARPMKSQVYECVNTGLKIEISDEWQLLFNNYLLENSFHLCAIKKIQEIMNLESNSIWEDLLPLTSVLRLNAPLLHVDFLNYVYKKMKQKHIPHKLASGDKNAGTQFFEELNDYIDYLNTCGLPMLEELFVWGVCSEFSYGEVFDNAELLLSEDVSKTEMLILDYYEDKRVNFDASRISKMYKIVPPEYIKRPRKRKGQKDIDAKVAKLSIMEALGYRQD